MRSEMTLRHYRGVLAEIRRSKLGIDVDGLIHRVESGRALDEPLEGSEAKPDAIRSLEVARG